MIHPMAARICSAFCRRIRAHAGDSATATESGAAEYGEYMHGNHDVTNPITQIRSSKNVHKPRSSSFRYGGQSRLTSQIRECGESQP